MEEQKKFSRRDALKRTAKTAMVVAVASIFPGENSLANTNLDYYNYGYSNGSGNYVDKCYNDYYNYHNYSNYNDYQNYNNYRDYSNYKNYQNYNDSASN